MFTSDLLSYLDSLRLIFLNYESTDLVASRNFLNLFLLSERNKKAPLIKLIKKRINIGVSRTNSDLEKAASGASVACGHFVGNHAILRTF